MYRKIRLTPIWRLDMNYDKDVYGQAAGHVDGLAPEVQSRRAQRGVLDLFPKTRDGATAPRVVLDEALAHGVQPVARLRLIPNEILPQPDFTPPEAA